MRKIYAFLTIALACASSFAQTAWDGSASSWTNGEGSESNPYLIENEAQLAYLSQQVRAGETYEGCWFKLTADLDMGADKGRTFLPIGFFDAGTNGETGQPQDDSFYFMGTFDGNHKTIDNICIDYQDESGVGGTGLFACITTGTKILNTTLGSRSTVCGWEVTGAIVGAMTGGSVERCRNLASVKAASYSGGIVGMCEGGVVSQCVNGGAVEGATEIGGIVGQAANGGVVEFCYNTGSVTATGFGGGGIGGALYNTFAIRNCYSVGKITGLSSPYLGSPHAVVSDSYSTNSIRNCYYVAELAGVDDEKATALTEDELKAADFPARLNFGTDEAVFVQDTKGLNGGFPVLAWEVSTATGISQASAGSDFTIDGRTLTSGDGVTVTDLSGRVVAAGKNLRLPGGLLIVTGKHAGKPFSRKVLVK